MALVDDQGRLFGRLNVVDAVVALFALALIPLIYGSVVLFRTPPPVVLAVEPASLSAGPGLRVKIRGQNLRPYMRVSFGTVQGRDFLFKSTTEAEVNLNEMGPGVYDVVLYDFAQERSRIPNAFTVLPTPIPPTKMILVGVFGNLDGERAKQLVPGVNIAGVGTILQVAAPVPATMRINGAPIVEVGMGDALMVPAVVETNCDVRVQQGAPYCQIGPMVLQHTTVLMGEAANGKLSFQIDQVRAATALEPVTVTVRFGGPTAVIRSIRPGDVDRGLFVNPLAAGATVTAVAFKAASPGSTEANVTLQVPVSRTSSGWQYVGLPLRAGGSFALRTQRYEVTGSVMQINPEWREANR